MDMESHAQNPTTSSDITTGSVGLKPKQRLDHVRNIADVNFVESIPTTSYYIVVFYTSYYSLLAA